MSQNENSTLLAQIHSLKTELTTLRHAHAQEIAAVRAHYEDQLRAGSRALAESRTRLETMAGANDELLRQMRLMRQEMAVLRGRG